ncbi:MAG: hypothetical protein NTY59_08150 [Alphaproteobacteria bacterium]|nr:hypothetical protein [Alphaproteobacteria bacterium]
MSVFQDWAEIRLIERISQGNEIEMSARRGSRTTAGALALLLTVSWLSGCDSIEKETGLSKDTQIGGVSGAAVGGVIAGLAGASPAWIAGSIILGGITGGVIGNYLGKGRRGNPRQDQSGSARQSGRGQNREVEGRRLGQLRQHDREQRDQQRRRLDLQDLHGNHPCRRQDHHPIGEGLQGARRFVERRAVLIRRQSSVPGRASV